jgi:hypothetical protein
MSTLWVSTGVTSPSPVTLSWAPRLVPIGWVAPHTGSPHFLLLPPPDPPPRACYS